MDTNNLTRVTSGEFEGELLATVWAYEAFWHNHTKQGEAGKVILVDGPFFTDDDVQVWQDSNGTRFTDEDIQLIGEAIGVIIFEDYDGSIFGTWYGKGEENVFDQMKRELALPDFDDSDVDYWDEPEEDLIDDEVYEEEFEDDDWRDDMQMDDEDWEKRRRGISSEEDDGGFICGTPDLE